MSTGGHIRESRVGRRFGYREPPVHWCDPLRPVEVVKEGPPRTQKVRIRWLDGEYEGLEEWVPQRRLEVPWEEAEAFLEDERRTVAAIEASGGAYRTLRYKAVEQVFLALPRDIPVYLGYRGGEQELLEIDDLEHTATRLGISRADLLAEPFAFIDREGTYKAPFATAERLARHCCTRFPKEILQRINREEEANRRAIVTGYYDPPDGPPDGDRDGYNVDVEKVRKLLAEQEPVYQLIHEWCGDTAVREYHECEVLRREVLHLRRLIEDAAAWIKERGSPQKASSLLRQMNQGPKYE